MIDLQWELINFSNRFDRIHVLRFYQISTLLSFLFFGFCSIFNAFARKRIQTKWKQILSSEYTYISAILVFLVLARWPGFLPPMVNPDERQFTAGAIKLFADPVFWRSVDGNTTGPLNVYVIMIPAFLGFRLDYATSRAIGLLLVFIAILGLYYSLRYLYNISVARLTLIPVVTTFALMRASNYIHYSSEHLSIALLSVTLALVCYSYSCEIRKTNIFAIGFLLGLIPFAKLQGIPIAAVISLLFLNILWIKRISISGFFKKVYLFLFATLLPTMIVFFVMIVFSSFDDFWKSYIIQNLFYTTDFKEKQASLIQKALLFFSWAVNPQETQALFKMTFLFSILTLLILLVLIYRSRKEVKKELHSSLFLFVPYAWLMIVASIFAIIKPGTFFVHYLLFLMIPCGFSLGIFIGEIYKSIDVFEIPFRQKKYLSFMIIAGIIFSIIPLLYFSLASNSWIWKQQSYREHYQSPITRSILKYSSPGEPMAVWGFAAHLYVDTGLPQATRDSITLWQIKPSDLQPYFLQRFLKDLAQSKAPLFVDAVTPKMSLFKDRDTQGHEAFPEVKKFVQDNYRLVEEVEGVRIYTRR